MSIELERLRQESKLGVSDTGEQSCRERQKSRARENKT